MKVKIIKNDGIAGKNREQHLFSVFNQQIPFLLEYVVLHTGMEDGSHWPFFYFVVNVCIMVMLTCNLFSFRFSI